MLSTVIKLPFVIKTFIVAVLHRFYCGMLQVIRIKFGESSCIVNKKYIQHDKTDWMLMW